MRPEDRHAGKTISLSPAMIVSFFLTLLIAWLVPVGVRAQSPDIEAALGYLIQSQSSDGSWTSSTLKASSVTTARAAEALLKWRTESSVPSDAALARAWVRLAARDSNRTETLADRIRLATLLPNSSTLEPPLSELLSTLRDLQNSSSGAPIPGTAFAFNLGGFGYGTGYMEDAWDTTCALRALIAQHTTEPLSPSQYLSDPILCATALLLEVQNIHLSTPGQCGWPAQDVEEAPDSIERTPDPLVTALTIETLASIPDDRRAISIDTYSFQARIDEALTQGLSFLGTFRRESQSMNYYQWSESTDLRHRLLLSSVVLRALSAAALRVSIDPLSVEPIRAFLIDNQTSNGSWLDDPFLTAEVLLALERSKPNLKFIGTPVLVPTEIEYGERLVLNLNDLRLTNSGSVQSNVTTIQCLLVNGSERIVLDTRFVPVLQPSDLLDLPVFSGSADILGTFDLVLCVDPDDYVAEVSEQDNVRSLGQFRVLTPPELAIHDVVASVQTPVPIPAPPVGISEAQSFYLAFSIVNSGQATAPEVPVGLFAVSTSGDESIPLHFDELWIDGTAENIQNPSANLRLTIGGASETGPNVVDCIVGIYQDPCRYLDEFAPENSHVPPGVFRIEVSIGEFDDSTPDDNSASFETLQVSPVLDVQFVELQPGIADPAVLLNCDGGVFPRDPDTGIYQIDAGEKLLVWPIRVQTIKLVPDAGEVWISDIGIALSWTREGSSAFTGFSQFYYWANQDLQTGGNWSCWAPSVPWYISHWMPAPIPGLCSWSENHTLMLDTANADSGEPLNPGLYTLRLTLDPNGDYDETPVGESNNNYDGIQFRIKGNPNLTLIRDQSSFIPTPSQFGTEYSGVITLLNAGETVIDTGASGFDLFHIELGNSPDVYDVTLQEFPSHLRIEPGESITTPPISWFIPFLGVQFDPIVRVILDPGNAWREGADGEADNLVEFCLEGPDFVIASIEVMTVPGGSGDEQFLRAGIGNPGESYFGDRPLTVEFVQFIPESTDLWVLDSQSILPSDIPLHGDVFNVEMARSKIPCGESFIHVRINSDRNIFESEYDNNFMENKDSIERDDEECLIDFSTDPTWVGFPYNPNATINAGEIITVHGKVACDRMNRENGCLLDDYPLKAREISVAFYHSEIAPGNLIHSFCLDLTSKPRVCDSWPWLYSQAISSCFHPDSFDWNPANDGLVGEIPIIYVVDEEDQFRETNEFNNRADFRTTLNVRYIDLSVMGSDIRLSHDVPIQGQEFGIEIRTRNQGTQELAYQVEAEVVIEITDAGGQLLATYPRREWHHFTPQEVFPITIEADWPQGEYTLTVRMDPTDVIREFGGGESNNIVVRPIIVSPPVNLKALSLSLEQTEYGVSCEAIDSNCSVFVGRPVDLEGVFLNQGVTEVSQVTAGLYVSDPEAGFPGAAYLFDRLEANGTGTISSENSWYPQVESDCDLVLVVDPDQSIEEPDETDNELSFELHIVNPEKPDLVMSNLVMTGNPIPGIIREGDTLHVSVQLRNDGLRPIPDGSDFEIGCYFSSTVTPEEFWSMLSEGSTELVPLYTWNVDEPLDIGEEVPIAFDWTINDVRGPGTIYVMADSRISTVNPNGDVDEIWESVCPISGGCNVVSEHILIHSDQHHFDTAREGGVEWLLDHQHVRNVGETGKLKATYYNLDPQQYGPGDSIPDSFGHYILLDADNTTPGINPLLTRVEDGTQIGFFDDIGNIPGLTPDHFAVIYEGYLNIEATTEFGLSFLVDAMGTGGGAKGRGWIWLNNRIMSPYNLQPSIPPMKNLPLEDYKFQSVFVRYNRGDLTDLAPGIDCDFKYRNTGDSGDAESILGSLYQYKLADGPYSLGLWDDQNNQVKQGMIGILFAKAWQLYGHLDDRLSYLPLEIHEYLTLIEFILDQQNDTGSWDENSSFWATAANLWALALARDILPQFSDYPDHVDEILERIGSISIPGSAPETGAIHRAIMYFTRSVYQVEGYHGTTSWPDAGLVDDLVTTAFALRALCAVDPDIEHFNAYIPNYAQDANTNLVYSLLHMFYLTYNNYGSGQPYDQYYWGLYPGDTRMLGFTWSPIQALIDFQNCSISAPLDLFKAKEFMFNVLNDSLSNQQPTLHWSSIIVGDVLSCLSGFMQCQGTMTNTILYCTYLSQLISRTTPDGPSTNADGGYYFQSGDEWFECPELDSSKRLVSEQEDFYLCALPIHLMEIFTNLSSWPSDDRPDNYPNMQLLDNVIKRRIGEVKSHISPLLHAIPMNSDHAESWISTGITMKALNVASISYTENQLSFAIQNALSNAYYCSGLFGNLEVAAFGDYIGYASQDPDPMSRALWAMASQNDSLPENAQTLVIKLKTILSELRNADGGLGLFIACYPTEIGSRNYETQLALIGLIEAGKAWSDPDIQEITDLLFNTFWEGGADGFEFDTGESIYAQIISTLPGAQTELPDMPQIYLQSREHLLAMHQNTYDGGWSYNAHPPSGLFFSSTVDATAMSLIALTHNHTGEYTLAEKIAISEGVNWLLLAQIKSDDPLYIDEFNGWGANLGSKTANTRDTALAVWALHAVDWYADIDVTAYINGCDPTPPVEFWTFHPGETVPVDIYLDRILDLSQPDSSLIYRVVSESSPSSEILTEFAFNATFPTSNRFSHSFTIPLGTQPGQYILIVNAAQGDETGADMNTFRIRIEPDALPDLVGRDLEGTHWILPEGTARIEMTIWNQGNAQANASQAMLYLNDPDNWLNPATALHSYYVPMLPVERMAPIEYEWIPDLPPGVYPLYLVVDNGNQIDESDETNNKYRFDLRIEPLTISWLGAGPDPFSPANSPGTLDTTGFYFELNGPSSVLARITRLLPNDTVEVVREIQTGCLEDGLHLIPWDGRDVTGEIVTASDRYHVELICDLNGESAEGDVEVDNIAPIVNLTDFDAPLCLAGVIPIDGTATDRNYLDLSDNFNDFELIARVAGQLAQEEFICSGMTPIEDDRLCSWDASRVEPEDYDLELVARDSAGNVSQTTTAVRIVEPPPCPLVIDPVPGSTLQTAERRLSISGVAFTRQLVVIINGESQIHDVQTFFSIDVELPACEHDIQVVSLDSCGNMSSDCQEFSVIVDEVSLAQTLGGNNLAPMTFIRGNTNIRDRRRAGPALDACATWTIRDADGTILNQEPDGSIINALEFSPWIEDSDPGTVSSTWQWTHEISALSGSACHTTLGALGMGIEMHAFSDASTPITIGKKQSLVQYVYLAPDQPPDALAVVLELRDIRVGLYWGSDDITGLPGGGIRAGDLPASGDWSRLNIDESLMQLSGQKITGMWFLTRNGFAFWDRTTIGFHEMCCSIDPGRQCDFPFEWFTGRLAAGDYSFTADLALNDLACYSISTPFNIFLSEGLECSLVTDDTIYSENDTVEVTSDLFNMGLNSTQEDLDVSVIVRYPSGEMEQLLAYTIDSMPPDTHLVRTAMFQTESHPQGEYQIEQTVARGETVITTCLSSIQIYWNPAGYLDPICSTDPGTAPIGSEVGLAYSITNRYPENLQNIEIWFDVFNEVSGDLTDSTSHEMIPLIAQGQAHQAVHVLNTDGFAPGDYAAFLMVRHESYETTLCLTWLTLTEQPTATPTPTCTLTPTNTPTWTPTDTPTAIPTDTPTFTPAPPTYTPTPAPTWTPVPTVTPTPNDVTCIEIRRGLYGDIPDAYIWDASHGYNGGSSSTLYTGYVSGYEKRTLIAFDLPVNLEEIEVVSAEFAINVTHASGAEVAVHSVTEDWTETGVTWGLINSAYDPDPYVSLVIDTNGWIIIDLTDLFVEWANGTRVYHGIMLISDTSSSYETYRSSESSISYRPILNLCYRYKPTPSPSHTPSPLPTSTPPPSFTPTPQPPTPTPPPSPTPSPFPCLGNPSLEFDPDEWIAISSGQTAVSTGDLCNTGGPGGDCASDIHFWWDETSGGFMDSVQFSGDFALMMGGDCRDLTVTATMAGLWASQPPGTEASAWLYAEPMNRPGHVAQVRLTITRTSSSR